MIDHIKNIEDKYQPLIELLETPEFLKTIKKEYKGFINAYNPLTYNPKILFIGINPGGGAFLEMNYSKTQKTKYPKMLLSSNKLSQIDWLKTGNARTENGTKYEWYERNRKVENVFVKRMIDFFFEYYKLDKKSDYSKIEKMINNEMFYTNIYPISTTNVKDLNPILKKISNTGINLNGKSVKPMKELKNFFRQRTIDLIDEIKPEVIICLGVQAFKDLTFTSPKINKSDFTIKHEIKIRNSEYPVYIVSRNGNWEGRIKKLGKKLHI